MGIPYSKQINLAFDQVTPLVAHGFKVLQTTRNITYVVAAVQILTVIFLFLILITLLGLIITVSPDLEQERLTLVTPLVRYLANSAVLYGGWLKVGLWILIVGCALGTSGGLYVSRERVEVVEVEDPEGEGKEGEDPES